MPNINQQKKRVRSAARERLENLRYRSTVKTLTKRLESAVESGENERVQTEHRELVRWIDRAAARGAIHRNAAARKKSQAARLAEVARLVVGLLDRVDAAALEAEGGILGRDAFGRKALAGPHESDVSREQADHAERNAGAGVAAALEHGLGSLEDTGDVASSPGIG